MKKIFLLSLLISSVLLSFSFVSAEGNCTFDDIKSYDAIVENLPEINAKLASCDYQVPSQMKRIMKSGVFLIDFSDVSDIYVNVDNGRVTSADIMSSGDYDYKVEMTECIFDRILNKENPVGAFASYYLSGKTPLKASGIFGKFKLFFGKLFVKKQLNNMKVDVEESCVVVEEEVQSTRFNGYHVCEFYQAPKVTKALVTCSAYKAGDSFCATATGSAKATALVCDDSGSVICGVPCSEKAPLFCGADINRKRGTNAKPLSFCEDYAGSSTNTKPSGEGRPSNCYDSYMQGYEEYQYPATKKLWDEYASQTSGFCQTQTSEPPKGGNCVYKYEQIKNNDKKWVCWYK